MRPIQVYRKMYVIGHNDVAANDPAVSITSRTPFVDQNVCDLVASKKLPAIFGARCHEINRRINPNAPKSSQMFVHVAVVAEGGDLGNLRCSCTHWPRSAPSATALALRGEHRFGIGAGDFAYRDPADAANQRTH